MTYSMKRSTKYNSEDIYDISVNIKQDSINTLSEKIDQKITLKEVKIKSMNFELAYCYDYLEIVPDNSYIKNITINNYDNDKKYQKGDSISITGIVTDHKPLANIFEEDKYNEKICIKNLNQDIYRWIPFERLIQLIQGTNTLVKPSVFWKDPFENPVLRGVTSEKKEMLPISEKFYAQSWSFLSESDAMWRIYSSNNDSVQIKTNLEKLLEATKKNDGLVYIGRVLYGEKKIISDITNKINKNVENYLTETKGNTRSLVETILWKRKPFEHENEIRLILYSDNNKDDLYKYKIDPLKLIETITFDPRIENDLFNYHRANLVTFGFKKKQIKKSKLYSI
jgi:hypothetical protein